MINFNGEHTWKLQEKGREQAQEALAAGEGVHYALLKQWLNSKDAQKEYPEFSDFVLE